jgi:hypothetical protein
VVGGQQLKEPRKEKKMFLTRENRPAFGRRGCFPGIAFPCERTRPPRNGGFYSFSSFKCCCFAPALPAISPPLSSLRARISVASALRSQKGNSLSYLLPEKLNKKNSISSPPPHPPTHPLTHTKQSVLVSFETHRREGWGIAGPPPFFY